MGWCLFGSVLLAALAWRRGHPAGLHVLAAWMGPLALWHSLEALSKVRLKPEHWSQQRFLYRFGDLIGASPDFSRQEVENTQATEQRSDLRFGIALSVGLLLSSVQWLSYFDQQPQLGHWELSPGYLIGLGVARIAETLAARCGLRLSSAFILGLMVAALAIVTLSWQPG